MKIDFDKNKYDEYCLVFRKLRRKIIKRDDELLTDDEIFEAKMLICDMIDYHINFTRYLKSLEELD